MWPDTPLAEQTRPRNACQKSVKQIKFSEMLPVEVFLETSVTMTEFSRLFQWKNILLLQKVRSKIQHMELHIHPIMEADVVFGWEYDDRYSVLP